MKALIIVNLGSPESLAKKDVAKFLFEFLNDKRVIDLPWVFRKLLVNLIIVPFRVGKSQAMYKQMWESDGSPIIKHGKNLANKLSKKLDGDMDVFLAMRYCKPNLTTVLESIRKQNYDEIIVFPLFPHYASSTNGSIIDKTMSIIKKWNNIPAIKFIGDFYDNDIFINAWANNIKQYNLEDYDHIILSYHGLPIRHVRSTHNNESCEKYSCKSEINEHNKFCYKAQTYATSRLLSKKLNISEDNYSICFQSRFSKNWLKPFIDDVILDLANKGIKKILVIPLSFVADCLETNFEIAIEYDALFKKNGGEKFTMVASLNSQDYWVDAIKKIVCLNNGSF